MPEALQLSRDDLSMSGAARSARLKNAVTGITVLPQHAQQHARRAPTGARVTVEFASDTRLPAMREVRICYDFAENGTWRECIGVPELTHTTGPAGYPGVQYHYRLSHWIAAPQIMCFVER